METPANRLAAIMDILEGKGYRIVEAKLRVSERDESAHISVKFYPSAITVRDGRRYRTDILYGQEHERLLLDALNFVSRKNEKLHWDPLVPTEG